MITYSFDVVVNGEITDARLDVRRMLRESSSAHASCDSAISKVVTIVPSTNSFRIPLTAQSFDAKTPHAG